MILIPSEIIQQTDPETKEVVLKKLILWTCPKNEMLATIDLLNKGSWPVLEDAGSLIDQIETGECSTVATEANFTFRDESEIPDKHRAIRDQAWGAIKEIIANEPDAYVKMERSQAINEACERTGLSRNAVKKHLLRYWHRGRCKNALLPDFNLCGGRDKERKPGKEKRGRPVIHGSRKGVNISEQIKNDMLACVKGWYGRTGSRSRLKQAYDKYNTHYCHDRKLDEKTGKIVSVPKPQFDKNGFPTFNQFYYYVSKTARSKQIQRSRNRLYYDRNKRGVTGSITLRANGPGSRYEIDATIADIYLVSQRDPSKVVGRPTVYFVVDVYTRMIVGLSVTYEQPSWNAAMEALTSAFMNKVEYCKKFDLEIEAHEWPAEGLPAAILYDGGELTSKHFENLANNYNIIGEKASAYRPDWKGLVENKFHITSQTIKDEKDIGVVPDEYTVRNGQDYRYDALFNIKEFTRFMILEIFKYNCDRTLTKYDADRDFVATGLPYFPTEIWHWAVNNRGGPRPCNIDEVRYSLLRKKQATVTESGISYKNLLWTCKKAVADDWFDHARQHGRRQLTIAYDPRFPDQAVWKDNEAPGVFHSLEITDRARAFEDVTEREIELLSLIQKQKRADARHEAQSRSANRQREQEEYLEAAKARKNSAIAENGPFEKNDMNDARSNELSDERKAAGGPAAMDPNYRESTEEADQTAPYAPPFKRSKFAPSNLV